jgi:hypothetical protein
MAERRRWSRLPLAIPVFIKGRAEEKEFLEFATALNVSAGGMLVAVSHALVLNDEVFIEIPTGPFVVLASFPRAVRTLRATVQRRSHVDVYNLVGLKFARPLTESLFGLRVQGRRRLKLSV